jgi:hypothetical protein
MTTPPDQAHTNKTAFEWKWCALASIAIVILSLAPQIHFWAVRGSAWNGAFTVVQGDELLYSAYVNALISGRPRRTDPPAGRDDHPSAPVAESLFSIQFIPPYVVAFFARIFGMPASTAFILLLGLEGLLTSVALCWLFTSMTGDKRFAAVAILAVLSFGALAGGQGLVWLILKPDVRFVGLPFLRRYEPGVPFPLCFVFCTLMWKALTASSIRKIHALSLVAGVAFGILVFSYYFLWSSMLAWFVCVSLLWFFLRRADSAKVIRVAIGVSVPLGVALATWAYLVSKVPSEAEKAQVLIFTRAPDLFRIPEILGAFILVVLLIAVRRGHVLLTDPRLIFTASFALLPFLVFNQQVITGRSIQPFHYEVLIANYVVLAGAVMLVKLLDVTVRARTAWLIVLLCVSWAAMEVGVPSPIRANNDVRLDEMVPVLKRLNELAQTDGTWQDLRQHGTTSAIVFSPQYGISRLLPTWAPQALLTGTGSGSFQAPPQAERKGWIYLHLYYCGKDEIYLRELLNDRINDPFLTYFVNSTIFGPERILLFLGRNAEPVSQTEIEKEVAEYAMFVRSFSRTDVLKRPVTYVVTRAADNSDLSRIDLWYERDAGERVGDYILYRVRLREVALHESRNLDRMYRIFRIPNQQLGTSNPNQTEPAIRTSKPSQQTEPAMGTSNPNQS